MTWKLNKIIRVILNGYKYPCNAQREEYLCAKPFRDIYIGRYAWKYFSVFNVGHLQVGIASPCGDLYFTRPLNDLKMCSAKDSLREIEQYLKY